MKINGKWFLAIILIFVCASVYAAFTDESRWTGPRSTGTDGDALIPINVTTFPRGFRLITNATTSYDFKETLFNLTNNQSYQFGTNFNNLLEHIIIQPNWTRSKTTVNWRFLIERDDGIILYNGGSIDQTGRMGLIVDLPLTGNINLTIQNVTIGTNFSVSVTYS